MIKTLFMVEILFPTLMINKMPQYINMRMESANAKCIYDELKRQSEWIGVTACDPDPWVAYQSFLKEYERQTKQKL